MQAIKVILGLFGLALVVGGVWLIAESDTGGDFRKPIGAILAIMGLPLIFFSLIGWLIGDNKRGHVEDMRQYDIWRGFARLNILRKLLVLLSMPILMIGGLFIFVGLVSDKGLDFGLIAFGVGVVLFLSAWPTALQNFRNTSLKGFASLALLIVVVLAGLAMAGNKFIADLTEQAEAMRTMPMEETKSMPLGQKLQIEEYRRKLAQKNGGTFLTYYSHGPKRSEENFADGELNGPSIEWYRNGQKHIEAGYVDGQKEGLETLWYESGAVSRQQRWVNGLRQGPYISWYENGQKSFEIDHTDGIEQGPGRKWDEDGNELPPR